MRIAAGVVGIILFVIGLVALVASVGGPQSGSQSLSMYCTVIDRSSGETRCTSGDNAGTSDAVDELFSVAEYERLGVIGGSLAICGSVLIGAAVAAGRRVAAPVVAPQVGYGYPPPVQ